MTSLFKFTRDDYIEHERQLALEEARLVALVEPAAQRMASMAMLQLKNHLVAPRQPKGRSYMCYVPCLYKDMLRLRKRVLEILADSGWTVSQIVLQRLDTVTDSRLELIKHLYTPAEQQEGGFWLTIDL
jgi:hypothetical protein